MNALGVCVCVCVCARLGPTCPQAHQEVTPSSHVTVTLALTTGFIFHHPQIMPLHTHARRHEGRRMLTHTHTYWR